MTIPVTHEGAEKSFGGTVEKCHFCEAPTRSWHENTNNPVCPDCAKQHKVAELPDWGRKIRALKRRQRRASV